MLTHLKIAGIDLEIESDFYKMFMDLHLANKNDKGLDETRKSLFKLYYPDMKDMSESLMDEMKKRLLNDPNKVVKMTVESNKKIDPTLANKILGN